jgi:hypothetical protein
MICPKRFAPGTSLAVSTLRTPSAFSASRFDSDDPRVNKIRIDWHRVEQADELQVIGELGPARHLGGAVVAPALVQGVLHDGPPSAARRLAAKASPAGEGETMRGHSDGLHRSVDVL